jgi:CRP/FNR family transcriptional regulator
MDPTEAVRTVPLFAGLRPSELRLIGEHLRKRCFRARTTVVRRDDPGSALFIILTGMVKVHYETRDGGETLLAVLTPGEVFGELSLFDGRGRSADVTTLEPTEVMVLTRDAMLQCIDRAPRIAVNLLATLAGRVRLLNEVNEDLVSRDAPGRMAKRLLALARKCGVKTPTGVDIGVRLSQSDLASFIGTTRETASKILNDFQSREWLAKDKQRRITLLREDRLIGRSGS